MDLFRDIHRRVYVPGEKNDNEWSSALGQALRRSNAEVGPLPSFSSGEEEVDSADPRRFATAVQVGGLVSFA